MVLIVLFCRLESVVIWVYVTVIYFRAVYASVSLGGAGLRWLINMDQSRFSLP